MECNVLDNLTYLSKYLDESTARVRELENELATARRENDTSSRILQLQSENEDLNIKLKMKTEMLDTSSKVKQESLREDASRIFQLESDNAHLRTQISSLRDNLKVKTEMLDGVAEVKKESNKVGSSSDAFESNTALTDGTRTNLCSDRRHKLNELQAQLKDTAELAAKTLRERLEGAKALDESRKECADLQATNSALLVEGRASDKRHTATYERLKAKHIKLKEQSTELENNNEELKQTIRELIDLVECLQEECQENKDLVTMVDNLSRRYTESETKCASLECRIAQIPNKDIVEIVEAHAKYLQYMSELSCPENPPPSLTTLDAVCHMSVNLHGYLAQNSAARRFLNHVLYLPRRLFAFSDFNYLAYGPTACYEPSTDSWSEGSDLVAFHGGTRELFVEREAFIVYVGTFLCHDLRKLHPAGTNLPANILPKTIMHAALGDLPSNHQRIIKQRYPDGRIKVEVTGLQCVGFNTELYDIIRKRFADDQKKKRKANEDLSEGGKKKKK
ncbi:hypothetical protein C8R45DRAFT_1134334, partial [Mycena sanguinolenta]